MTNSIASTNTAAPAEEHFLPGPVLLIGAPGVGKGTQAQILVSQFGIPQISTGDLLRRHRREHTELGMLADNLMSQGLLVPDDLVNQMVAVRLAEPDTKHGYVLDGFPRTIAQAEWMDRYAAEESTLPPLVAVQIRVDEAQLLRRITGRRTCPTCNRIYNIYFNPPKNDALCDDDGTPLVQRADDTEEAFAKRMKEYEAKTMPVIPHYERSGRFLVVEGDAPMEQVSADILGAIRTLRAKFPAGGAR